jgi:hypothetical protein
MPTRALRLRCRNCQKKFTPSRDWQEFHSDECRKQFHRNGQVSAVAVERLVKKAVARWVDGIVVREVGKAKAKLLAEIEAELRTLRKRIEDLGYEKQDREGLYD